MKIILNINDFTFLSQKLHLEVLVLVAALDLVLDLLEETEGKSALGRREIETGNVMKKIRKKNGKVESEVGVEDVLDHHLAGGCELSHAIMSKFLKFYYTCKSFASYLVLLGILT